MANYCNPTPLRQNGPWGENVGTAKDVNGVPQRLESITIRSGWVIDSLEFSYISRDGQRHTLGPWGGFGGKEKKICLGPTEFVREVSGTVGNYEDNVVVRTLKIVTNICTYGPFGREQNNGTPFSSQGTIVGFHGYCGDYLNSIGTYTV
ncbi:hypothetical protein ACP70R_042885 [Stipagrostis hirtigluma subsp. patula]